MRIWILTILLMLFLLPTYGQTPAFVIKGHVIFGDSGEDGLGTTIVEKDTNNGTVTDLDGNFSLKVEKLPATIEVRFIGYSSQEIVVKSVDEPLEIVLESNFMGYPDPGIVVIDRRLKYSANYSSLQPVDLHLDQSATILNSMNTAPGLHIHTGALNTNRITIRGIGNRSQFTTAKIRAYLNDIPLTSGVGETTLEDIDMDLLSSIKIVKGPNVSNYGSGLGGSIIMKTAGNDSRKFVNSRFEVGSYGYLRTSNTINLGNEKNVLRANYSLTHSDGYRDNNQYDRHQFSLVDEFNYDNKQLTFLLNYTDLKAFIPSSLNEEDFLNEPSKAAFTWGRVRGFEDYSKIQVGLSHKVFWKDWYNSTSVFGTFYDSYESRPFNILTEDSRSLGFRSKFYYNFRAFGEEQVLSFGGEFFNEKYDWQTYETDDGILGAHLSDNVETRQYFNIFAEANWKLFRNFTVETGINFNSTQYNLEDRFVLDSIDISGDYAFKPIISPRLGINYLWRDKLISFYGNISHGFNPPTLEETLTPDGAINPDIQPEKGWSYEIGSRGDILDGSLSYNASIYYMDVRDLLVAKRLELDQFQGINAGRTSHMGLELDLKYNKRWKKMILKPFVNYHYANYQFVEFIDGDDDFSGNELTGAVPHKINSGIRIQSDLGLYGNIIHQFVDQMPMRDDNSVYSDSYNTMNMKIGYSNRFGKTKNGSNTKFHIDIYAGIRNIWNEQYASQILINAGSFGGNAPRYYYPGLPRNFYGGLSFRYGW